MFTSNQDLREEEVLWCGRSWLRQLLLLQAASQQAAALPPRRQASIELVGKIKFSELPIELRL